MATVKFKKLDPNAIIPTYGTNKSAGMDLYALETVSVNFGEVVKARTGLAVQLPEGYEGQVRPRSGNAAKYGVTVVNAPGTIDEDFRGELMVILTKETTEGAVTFSKGDRIAQLVVKAVEYHEIEEITEFDDGGKTERGTGGFGSTGQ
jgi:dUTP pyrophosphatase